MTCLHPSLPNSINIYIEPRGKHIYLFSSNNTNVPCHVKYRTLYLRFTLGLPQEFCYRLRLGQVDTTAPYTPMHS